LLSLITTLARAIMNTMILRESAIIKTREWVQAALTVEADNPIGPNTYLTPFQPLPDGMLAVPRQWALDNMEELGVTSVRDEQVVPVKLTDPSETELTLPSGLRPHQVQAVDAVVAALTREPYGGGALLVLPCGFGKSVSALATIDRIRERTLIVVHTKVLLQQWLDVVLQYIPGASVGKIHQKHFDVEGRSHVIAMAHSLVASKKDIRACGFGLLIVDECHRICCPTLSKVFQRAGTRRRLGLSATPDRTDGYSKLLEWGFGEVAFMATRDPRADLRVYAIHLDDGPSRHHTIRVQGKDVSCIARMLNDLEGGEGRAAERQELAATWIRRSVEKRRQVLVVSDRLSLLDDLALRIAPITSTFLIGKTKKAERSLVGTCPVVFASYACATEGLDVPTLDTLILLTPRSGFNTITQIVGRLFRDGGRSPLVIDFVDTLHTFQGQYRKRAKYYRDMGADVVRFNERDERL
jgi:superfamily II DNA or RNA helicase